MYIFWIITFNLHIITYWFENYTLNVYLLQYRLINLLIVVYRINVTLFLVIFKFFYMLNYIIYVSQLLFILVQKLFNIYINGSFSVSKQTHRIKNTPPHTQVTVRTLYLVVHFLLI